MSFETDPEGDVIDIPSQVRLNAVVPAELKYDEDDDKKKQKRFDMTAYTGAIVNLGGYDAIFSTSGIKLGESKKPILKQHDHNQIVGYTESLTSDGANLYAHGVLLDGDSHPAAQEVISASAQGFPWQASVGLEIDESGIVNLQDGEELEINGLNVKGPLLVMNKTTLKEISFVPLGADSQTRVAVALAKDLPRLLIPVKKGPKQMEDVKTTAQEIKAQFIGDSEFALESIVSGLTLEESKVAYADKILRDFEDLKEKNAELEAKLEKRKVEPLTVTTPQAEKSARDEWTVELSRNKDLGMSNADAVRRIVTTKPELHEAYLAEVNGGRG